MEDDVRKDYILTTASNFFAKEPKEFFKKFAADKHVTKFLDDLNVFMLVVNAASKEITFTTKFENISGLSGKSLVFFKTSDEAITAENLKKNILISSIIDSPIETLFHLIHNVYAPFLQVHQSQNSRGSDVFDTKLTNNLADLESNLKSAMKRAENGDSSRKSTLSPLDEFQYWADMSERGKSSESKERAAFFYSEFQPLVKFYKKIDSCAIHEILEIIEATQDAYDFVWQQVDFEPTYSQERMTNLLEITGN